MTTVYGYFETLNNASNAITDLVNLGINRNNISLISIDKNTDYTSYFDAEGHYIPSTEAVRQRVETSTDEAGEGAAKGAGIGATLGGIGGILMGLGLLAIPGVGPALAAGPIVSGLVGAGIGGTAGGLGGALVNSGIKEEDLPYYEEGLRRGGHLLIASVNENQSANAEDVLARHNAVDIRHRAENWREEGWKYNPVR